MIMNDIHTRYTRFDYIRGKNVHTLKEEEYELFFNNKYCTNYGLFISEYPTIPKINEEVEEVEVEGRNGSLTVRKGTYKDRNITFSFKLYDNELFWSKIDDAEEWLLNFTDNRLFYNRKDRCFSVKRVIIGDISKEVKLYGEFDVTFVCEPFMKDINPSSYTFLENEKIIINTGHFDVEPLIELYGNGNLEISINGESTIIENVSNKVIIDSEFMVCVDENYNNKLIDMIGKFPRLIRGDNEIIVNNNVIKTNIKFINLYR